MIEETVQENTNEIAGDKISRALEELGYGREPTEDELNELHEQHMKELENERQAKIIFDAGSGKRMTLSAFKRFYGTTEFSDELIEAAKRREQYSKETAIKIKRLYDKKATVRNEVIKPKKDPPKQPEQPIKPKTKQDQFLKVPYRFLDKVKNSRCHRNARTH